MIASEDFSVLTNDLLLGVAGNFFKCRICVIHRSPSIGDDNTFSGLFDGSCQMQ